MKIAGCGHVSAGEYVDGIYVSGTATIDGNVACKEFKCSGTGKALGTLTVAEGVSVSGSFKADGSMKAKSVHVSGSLKSAGDVIAEDEMKVSGSIKAAGLIKCSSLSVSGGISADVGIEAENVKISGSVHSAGLLNAENIEIVLQGSPDSRLGSIGGSNIHIYPWRRGIDVRVPLFSKLLGKGLLTVDDAIEGDEVALEYVKAKQVVGRNVKIGAGCEIEHVQYSETVDIDPEAKVGSYEKL